MRFTKIGATVLAVLILSGYAAQVSAYPAAARATKAACASCHTNVAGGAGLSEAGKAWAADNAKAPAAGEANEYVGSAKCKMCHLKQYKAWGETKHAKAMASLKAGDEKAVAAMATALKVELKGSPAESEACIGCHVTGHKLAGGYPPADATKMDSFAAVGCESCHGPGGKHVAAPKEEKKKFIAATVTEKMCKQCHTSATSPEFKFDEYKTKGIHTVAAE